MHAAILVCCPGDLKNGRTVHSLAYLAALYGLRMNFVSPPLLRMSPSSLADIRATASSFGGECNELDASALSSVLRSTDVLYVTRVQKERFADLAEYEALKEAFVISKKTLMGAKKNTVNRWMT
jgi:aspartate carbamoyltransferase catalytic subunit